MRAGYNPSILDIDKDDKDDKDAVDVATGDDTVAGGATVDAIDPNAGVDPNAGADTSTTKVDPNASVDPNAGADVDTTKVDPNADVDITKSDKFTGAGETFTKVSPPLTLPPGGTPPGGGDTPELFATLDSTPAFQETTETRVTPAELAAILASEQSETVKTGPALTAALAAAAGGGGGGGGGGGSAMAPSGGIRTALGGPGPLVDIDYLYDFADSLSQPFQVTQEDEEDILRLIRGR